jgi:hypothetical protein
MLFRGYSLLDAGDGVFSVNDGGLLALDTGSKSELCRHWYISGSMVFEETYTLTQMSLLTSSMALPMLALSPAVSSVVELKVDMVCWMDLRSCLRLV